MAGDPHGPAAANYGNGSVFSYTYDAVGNRLTQTTITNTTVYTYDDANRLINVGGVAQTWDNNGNLLSDGVYTYTYDSANHPITIKQGTTLTYTFGYDGLGDRVRQTINGITTTYALNLNAGLTQVLADGTNTYLYGNGRIAQYAGTTPSYFLPDALGSVRQLANASGVVTLAKSYQPYGSVMSSVGTATSTYGFTGEATDNTGLVYLRARYYGPQWGRFITRDTLPGDYQQSMSFNAWLYVYANPINLTDPSGLFGLPPEVEKILKENRTIAMGIIWAARIQFSRYGVSRFCVIPDDGQHSYDTVNDLYTDFICEYGKNERTFGADARLTQELALSHSIYEHRAAFYEGGGYLAPGEESYGWEDFAWAKVDIVLNGGNTNFIFNTNWPLNIVDFLGSYHYEVVQTSRNTVKFTITNRTSLESGTRIIYPPGSPQTSLEEYWENPNIYQNYHIGWILEAKSRVDTTGWWGEGGGDYYETFTWEEPFDSIYACLQWYPPFPIGLLPSLIMMQAENGP